MDAIIVTHGDADHYNGIPFLLQRFRPDIIWVNEGSGDSNEYTAMLALAARLHIKVQIPQPGEQLIHGGAAVLVNLTGPGAASAASFNDHSLIVRFEQDKFSCLFAGDISQNIEARLIADQLPLQSTLLLSPHHGSATSNSESFLQTVIPDIIVVSAGRFRPNHFPAPLVRQRCRDLGIRMLITAEQGAITFSNKDGHFSLQE